MVDGMFSSPSQTADASSSGNKGDQVDHAEPDQHQRQDQTQQQRVESPDDLEKEERRRAAHKVLGKQG